MDVSVVKKGYKKSYCGNNSQNAQFKSCYNLNVYNIIILHFLYLFNVDRAVNAMIMRTKGF